MEQVRVLIADDEPPARRRLRNLLAGDQEIEIVGEAGSGREAVAAIRSLAPDLVFLDVQMPELDGFGVVAEVGVELMPTVVFVTAFNEYALRAFEASALDYLLKPFDDERFERVLTRAREEIRRDRLEDLCGKLRVLLNDKPVETLTGESQAGLRDETSHRETSHRETSHRETSHRETSHRETSHRETLDRLVIRSSGRVMWVDTEDVDWIEGAGSYARLHVGTRSYLLRQTLRHLEASLDPNRFLRIHRSTIVNGQRVRELRPRSHGESIVILRDGTELRLSRTYRDRLDRLLLS